MRPLRSAVCQPLHPRRSGRRRLCEGSDDSSSRRHGDAKSRSADAWTRSSASGSRKPDACWISEPAAAPFRMSRQRAGGKPKAASRIAGCAIGPWSTTVCGFGPALCSSSATPDKSYDVVTLWDVLEHTPGSKDRSLRGAPAIERRTGCSSSIIPISAAGSRAPWDARGCFSLTCIFTISRARQFESSSMMPDLRSCASARIFSTWRLDTFSVEQCPMRALRQAPAERLFRSDRNCRVAGAWHRMGQTQSLPASVPHSTDFSLGLRASTMMVRGSDVKPRDLPARAVGFLRPTQARAVAVCRGARLQRITSPAVPATMDVDGSREINALPLPTGTSWTPRNRFNVGLGGLR